MKKNESPEAYLTDLERAALKARPTEYSRSLMRRVLTAKKPSQLPSDEELAGVENTDPELYAFAQQRKTNLYCKAAIRNSIIALVLSAVAITIRLGQLIWQKL